MWGPCCSCGEQHLLPRLRLGFAFRVSAVASKAAGVFFRRIVCECGYLREQHLDDAAKPPIFLGKEWDPSRHIQEMPTDAFGDIHFTGLGQKTGKVSCSSRLWVHGVPVFGSGHGRGHGIISLLNERTLGKGGTAPKAAGTQAAEGLRQDPSSQPWTLSGTTRLVIQGLVAPCPCPSICRGNVCSQGSEWERGHGQSNTTAAEWWWEISDSWVGQEELWQRCPVPLTPLFTPKTCARSLSLQYVRVSSDTPPRVIYHLMTQHWGLDAPNLLISVTGGAKNFVMKPRLKNIFRQGLVKVAQTTGKRPQEGKITES